MTMRLKSQRLSACFLSLLLTLSWLPSSHAQNPAATTDTPEASALRTLKLSASRSTPPGVMRLMNRIQAEPRSSKVRYTSLAREALIDAIHKTQVPQIQGLAAFPKLSADNANTLIDQLTEDQVHQILAAKVKSLVGARPPANLRQAIQTQNEKARARAVVRTPRAMLGAPGTPQPSPNLTHFDWRDKGWVVQDSGIVTAVKNQGGCGCCWAFATVAAVEAGYARDNLDLINASEQYVLNNSGFLANGAQLYSCEGGWWAFDLLLAGTNPNGGSPGIPRTSDLAYQGAQGAPVSGLNLPYKIQAWGYVETNDPNGLPDDPSLKSALCEKGPLAIGVNVPTDASGTAVVSWAMNQGDALGDFPNNPSQSISHVVLLVGWDDNITSQDGTRRGAWIIKNSWGAWGIPLADGETGSGFGYVSYGYNNVGLGASWVVAAPPGS